MGTNAQSATAGLSHKNIMKNKDHISNLTHYVFILAHPDEEIYTCNFMADLVRSRKPLDVIYATSGDYHGQEMGKLREQESLDAMELIGVPENRVHFLRMPERELINRLEETLTLVLEKVEALKPDCIISHDFEGGHNHHDAVSFCASKVSTKLKIPLYVFPAYYGWPEQRLFNQFIPPRKATYTFKLTFEQKSFKTKIMFAHKSQWGGFMEAVERSDDQLFFEREVLRYVDSPIDYTQKPTDPIGYEFLNSKAKFDDFQRVISSIK